MEQHPDTDPRQGEADDFPSALLWPPMSRTAWGRTRDPEPLPADIRPDAAATGPAQVFDRAVAAIESARTFEDLSRIERVVMATQLDNPSVVDCSLWSVSGGGNLPGA